MKVIQLARPYFLPLIFALVSAMLLVFATQKYGIGVSPDSVAYISTAKNLLAGNGLTTYLNTPMVLWPPFYPLVLALVGAAGMNVSTAAIWINMISFGLLVFLTMVWLRQRLKSPFLLITAGLTLVVAIPLWGTFVFAWSEPLFICLALIFILLLEKAIKDSGYLWLIASAGVASVCLLTRYIGFTVVIVGLIFLWSHKFPSLIQKLIYVASFLLISCVPMALWLARNYRLTSTLTGPRGTNTFRLIQNLRDGMDSLIGWFFPVGLIPNILRVTGGILLLLMLVSIAVTIVRLPLFYERIWQNPETRTARMMVCFVLVYAFSIAILTSIIEADTLDDRLLSPIFPFTILILFYALDRIWREPMRPEVLRVWRLAPGLLLGICVTLMLLSTARDIRYFLNNGAGRWGFSTTQWRESKLIRYLADQVTETTIYSNEADAIYYLDNILAKNIPASVTLNPTDKVYIVWFNNGYGKMTNSVLGGYIDRFHLRPVFTAPDGTVYAPNQLQISRVVANSSGTVR